ncbi:HNH endonuclease signature motif containing protein, partial [Arthrobacter sp. Br18]|uniref:HNH endonuclease n=1 Tax=Arthrobacter sp. Br18 TaxID=1312954 RepID=UPI00055ECDD8
CSRAAAHCEIDHSVPWSRAGTTDHDNLAHLCPKHHRFKTITTWNLTNNTAGTLTWTSPTHRTYTTTPTNPSGTPTGTPTGTPQEYPHRDPKATPTPDPAPF